MAQAVTERTGARFGVFEVDFTSGELRKRGVRIPIQAQPLKILQMLLEQPGAVVTRQHLREALWPSDTFVDFESGLNNAVKRLRVALGDSGDNPRFIETLARRGYRFIAPALELTKGDEEASAPASRVLVSPASEKSPRRKAIWMLAGLGGIVLLALYWLFPTAMPRVSRLVQITSSVAVDPWGGLVTDGARLFFLERDRDHWNVVQTSTLGGAVERFPAPFQNTRILDVSPDLSSFLIAQFVKRDADMPLWILPVQGGAPRRVGDIAVSFARWTPEGRRILYGRGRDLMFVDSDGSNPRRFLQTRGDPFSPAWSPDGKTLRYTVEEAGSRAIWEVAAIGGEPHRFLAGQRKTPGECCGRFSEDGRFYFFSSWEGGQNGVWAVREGAGFPRRIRREPFALTRGPGEFWDPVPSRDGKRVFLFGRRSGTDEVSRYQVATGRFLPYMPQIHASEVSLSRDGQWIAYTGAEQTASRGRVDGTESRQLTFPPLKAGRLTWSPDGRLIAFQGETLAASPRIYVVASDGGAPRQILASEETQAFPDWSPDGKSLAFTAYSDRAGASASAILLLEIKTGKVSRLAGSEGLLDPKWSPDARRIAAISGDQKTLKVFDFGVGKWEDVATGVLLVSPNWSHEGEFLYFQDLLEKDEPVYRLQVGHARRYRIADFPESTVTGVYRYCFTGLTPEEDLLLQLNHSHADIYALDLEP